MQWSSLMSDYYTWGWSRHSGYLQCFRQIPHVTQFECYYSDAKEDIEAVAGEDHLWNLTIQLDFLKCVLVTMLFTNLTSYNGELESYRFPPHISQDLSGRAKVLARGADILPEIGTSILTCKLHVFTIKILS